MAVYSTAPGICAVDEKAIPKIDAGGKGFKSPLPSLDEMYDADGKAEHRYTYEALCKKHYLKAYKEVYPDAKVPAI